MSVSIRKSADITLTFICLSPIRNSIQVMLRMWAVNLLKYIYVQNNTKPTNTTDCMVLKNKLKLKYHEKPIKDSCTKRL